MTEFKIGLAIETSCDDTSVALVRSDGFVLSQLSANQDSEHLPFGGVVPEIASRNHTLALLPLIDQLLKSQNLNGKDLSVICVTNRPGLVGSLLVGLVTAKTLSILWDIPFVGVNHLEGHLLAPWLSDESYQPKTLLADSLPSLVLAVSGGHTHLCEISELGSYKILGQSLDDAAGEALDKFAKELGLGFPGGAKLDAWARQGDAHKFQFSTGLKNKGLNFSFSGTKASALRLLEKMSPQDIDSEIYNLCASYEKNVIDVLFEKLKVACQLNEYKSIALTGGVSANTYLRKSALKLSDELDKPILIPPLKYCTDNAAMIGFAGIKRFLQGEKALQNLAPFPRSLEDDFTYAKQEVRLGNN
jgi:N6-L-threonylcarbamoyladenine synthase